MCEKEVDHHDPNAYPDAWEMRKPGMERLATRDQPQNRLLNRKTEKLRRKELRRSAEVSRFR